MTLEVFPDITDIHAIEDYLSENIMKPLVDAFYEMVKVKPQTEPLEWIANYLLGNNNPEPVTQPPSAETLELIEKMRWEAENKVEIIPSREKLECGCNIPVRKDHVCE